MTDDESSGLPRLSIPDEDEDRASAETRLLEPAEMLYGGKKRMPWLVAVHGTRSAGRMFQVRSGMTIGRAIGSDILLDEEGVSRRHARLKVLATGQVLIEDLGSSNGLFFGELRVERRVLSDGDRIRIGDVVLTLLLLDAPDDASGVPLEAIDAETRLPNRLYTLSCLADALDYAGCYDAPVTFCLLLVDQLREIRDAQGAAATGAIMAHLGMTARNVLQDDEACVGRFSEDELGIVLPDTELEQGARCAEWIRRALEVTAVQVASQNVHVTVTGGVASKRRGAAPTSAELVEQARHNLCRAILAGRNCIQPAPQPSSSQPKGGTDRGQTP